MEKEEWRDIPGYVGYYQISNYGKIKSLERITCQGKKLKEKILKPIFNKDGYITCTLCKDGSKQLFLVHRLVGMTFIPNPDNLPTINHKDGNKTNNYIGNLEWCTLIENNLHCQIYLKRGIYNEDIKAKAHKSSLDVCSFQIKVVHLDTGGEDIYPSIRECARQNKISQSDIGKRLNGKLSNPAIRGKCKNLLFVKL